mmetsp:Transcript_18438/g.37215  ORF Transcript_18438/g.37215 Transcript_18438/m.37215 type:complete len:175 (-) Transcript_18438:288-812(-)
MEADLAGWGERKWACEACTFLNVQAVDECEVCDTPRPPPREESEGKGQREAKGEEGRVDKEIEKEKEKEKERAKSPREAKVEDGYSEKEKQKEKDRAIELKRAEESLENTLTNLKLDSYLESLKVLKVTTIDQIAIASNEEINKIMKAAKMKIGHQMRFKRLYYSLKDGDSRFR